MKRSIRPILSCLLFALLAASVSAQTTRFAVLGDYGEPGKPEADVSAMIHAWNPDFIITMGDNFYDAPSQIDADIGQFYHDFIYPYAGRYGAGASTNRFWPCLGNHDWGNIYP